MHKEKQLALFDAPTLARLRTLFDYPPSEIPGGPVLLGNRCGFKHHEEYGKVITCEKCGGPLTCGPFAHACKVCDQFDFKKCGICNQLRVFCCC